MREILFRGKRLDNDEWVEGNLITGTHWLDKNEIAAIVPLDNTFYPRCEITCWFEVAPSTVGQFTGLCDKNGKKIFEGDVVRRTDYRHNIRYEIAWNNLLTGYWYIRDDTFYSVLTKGCEIIGNIHDNRELLEGEG